MRWFAPVVIVALVVMGATPPAQATRTSEHRSSVNAAQGPVKLVPRRAVIERGAASDRRTDSDEVFLVPRTVEIVAIPSLSLLPVPAILVPRITAALVEQIARGPPSPVVLSHPQRSRTTLI